MFYYLLAGMLLGACAFKIKSKRNSVSYAPLTHLSPENTTIAFDIHGVLFGPDYRKMARIVWHMQGKGHLLLTACHPTFIYDILSLVYQQAVAEQTFFYLAKKYNLQDYVPDAIAIANCQTPIQGSMQLIQHLKQKGYTLHILSNIGTTIFADLQKKYPETFCHFEKTRTTRPADNYLRKPNADFFYDYLVEFAQHNRTVVFIDDKRSNIKTAHHVGLIGVHFTSSDNAHKILEQLSIL